MHPLAPGTQVGAWRVESLHGRGSFGALYRAVSVDPARPEPVALKVSLSPWDLRFGREAQLLSRLSLPGVPRLLDRGVVRHASGDEYAFLVMEWVEGTPLYAWAQQHEPSPRDMCRVLARLARTLEALHAAGVVHRDVKGDNVLVRLSDRFPVLIDLGSGYFEGAPRLTWQSLPPATHEYLSPQACRFEIRLALHRDSYYPPSPADDLYALGMTAWRLVLGQYPPPLDAQEDEEGYWHILSPDFRRLLESHPRVPPRLRALLLRLLSEAPEARGTAAQAATELEAIAEERVRRARAWKHGLALAAAAGLGVLLWNVAPGRGTPGQRASDFQSPDAGTSAVGDTSPTPPPVPSQEKKPVAQEPLPEPRPGQTRPDKSGRCPGRKQVLINGACWFEVLQLSAEECVENGSVLFNGKCYEPVHAPPTKPQPTSSPPEAR
ncbi:MAG TPA: serine/threonine-protein kinase [Myxococcaceae bacterium]|nr:serine/threonine-protein kinase [Myxococcaceae bacterium]